MLMKGLQNLFLFRECCSHLFALSLKGDGDIPNIQYRPPCLGP